MARENIILFLLDDGPPDVFPKMSALNTKPSGSWIDFPNCCHSAPQCNPGRVTVWTGRFSRNHKVTDNANTAETWDLNNSSHVLAKWLKDAGYNTAFFGKYLNGYPWSRGNGYKPTGWDHFVAFHSGAAYLSYTLNENGSLVTYGSSDTWTAGNRTVATDYSTDNLSRKAQDWIRNVAKEPFFLQISFKSPHRDGANPSVPASRHSALAYTTERSPSFNEADISDKPKWLRDLVPNLLTTAEMDTIDTEQKRAWRTVQSVDECMTDIRAAVSDRGALARTDEIFLSDNGFLRGQHRLSRKNNVYEASSCTQLWIRMPGIASRTETAPVSVTDLAPTICEIAQVRASRPFDGMSLIPLLDGRIPSSAWRQGVRIEYTNNAESPEIPTFTAIRTNTRKYCELDALGATPAESELYLLDSDPDELNNVSGNVAYATEKADLSAYLAKLKKA